MRKRNSFFNPVSKNTEPLASMIQKTITMVEKIKGDTQDAVNVDLNKMCTDIQDIKTILKKQTQDIDYLYTKKTDEKVQDLETDMSLMKISLHSLLEELKDLKILIEEGIDDSLSNNNYLVQKVLIEIYQKFLPISGGMLTGNIDMNRHTISGLETPKNPKDSYAASVGYLNSKLRPIEDKLHETHEKVKNHDNSITTLTFQMMPVSGGKFRGLVDMDGYRITGLANPKERSDAISLEYLERYLESQHLSKVIEEAPVQSQTTRTEAYLLCSTGLSHEVDFPLPLELLSQGILGFTWGAKSPRCSGKFPMNSLQYSSSDEERSCFVLDDDVLYGKYPGIYTWELTLKALVPSILDYSHPCIQLKIYYNYLAWNSKEELQGNMSSIEVPLHRVGTTTIGGCNYDIVELPAGNARVFTVPKHCGGVSMHLENIKEGAFAEDLYIIQAAYSCSWRRY